MTESDDRLAAMERRLQQDLDEIASLGRGGVRVDPGKGPKAVVKTLRESADRLGFASPIDAATHVLRRWDDLPSPGDGNPIPVYHASASETVRAGRARTEKMSGGTLGLVFERRVELTPLATMTLATRVTLDSDGTAHLADHGRPAPPIRPVHDFTGTPEELLESARGDLSNPEIPLERSLLLLWGARIGSTELVGTQEQRLLVAEGAAVRGGEIRVLLDRAEQAAASPTEEWYTACLYRSLLENLFEGFLGAVTFSLVDPEDIDGVDDELRRRLPEAEDAAPGAVPSGVPEGHWWWRAPFTRS